MQKWGGRPHRRGEIDELGRDTHGRWFHGPVGGEVTFGEDVVRAREQDVLFLLPERDWWCAGWWLGHPEVTLYVDIATPAEWHDDLVVTVDLDLDVVEFLDGRVVVADRDEFELHRAAYGYPADVIAAAERACAEVVDRVTHRSAPFDEATPRSWFTRVESVRRLLEEAGS